MAAAISPQTPKSQEFSVQVSREGRKKFHLMKFASGSEIDFSKLKNAGLKLERENNLKDYKSAYDIDVAPKFGAGSVFGREQKEEARRRKYGIMRKKYDSEKQPWLLKVGTGKLAKKYKGVREGTVSDNTSYYIFTQKPDGAFEAFPINDWYTFSQIIKYKYLNTEEAEDEFSKRDKTLNYFNIMLKKRLTLEEDAKNVDKEENEKAQKTKGKKDKDFLLTEIDEWAIMSDEDGDADVEDDDEKAKDSDGDAGKKSKRKDKKDGVKKRPKNAKQNSDDEAVEESDEGDFDDREVDYMTGSESSLSDVEEKGKLEEDKGVDEEHGLRKLIDSGDESEEEEKEGENETKDGEEDKAKKGSGSDSSSSESSDSDLEKDVKSAIFIQKKNLMKKEKQRSRSSTPQNTPDMVGGDKKVANPKRKQEGGDATSSKKPRTNSPLLMAGPPGEGITEEAIRRYLMRKPMTTKDLLQKFKSKKINMTSDQMATEIAQLLKRVNPDQNYVNKTLYLSLKAPDK